MTPDRRRPTAPAVFAVTLGCPKNRVDTEVMLGDLLFHGYELAADPSEADVLLVNTCGFLAEARRESLQTLVEMAGRMNPKARLVAAGCMTEAFRKEITSAVPRIELLVGTRELLRLRGRLEGIPCPEESDPGADNPRLVSTAPHLAYLKVADGCSRRCSFCIIPRLKGRQRSRTPDDLVAEASGLASVGVRELVLVAQDLVHYGNDLSGQPGPAVLVRRIAEEVPDLRWIRLMYLFPRDLSEGLLDVVAGQEKVLPYLDIPVQHADDRILASMRRGTSRRSLLRLVDRIRERIPAAFLRTTYLIGFPGEDPDAFENLLDFARITRFEMAGVFRFSAEPGSLAASLPRQVPEAVKRKRQRRLQEVLDGIATESRRAMEGQIHEALVESRAGSHRAVGRFWFQAPEVDGSLHIAHCSARPGSFVQVQVSDAQGTDFLGDRV